MALRVEGLKVIVVVVLETQLHNLLHIFCPTLLCSIPFPFDPMTMLHEATSGFPCILCLLFSPCHINDGNFYVTHLL